MTYQEFLQKLRESPRNWYLEGPRHEIRRGRYGKLECPGLAFGIFDYPDKVGAVWTKRCMIAEAADNVRKHDPEIRRDLLEACGLSDV